jgi:DNA-binding SARP family transcriptional activator
MPRHVPPANRRAAAIAAGLAALTGMLALVVAVPIILATAWHVLGPPIPSIHDLTGPDNGTVFVRTLCLIGWAAWASFTWATVAEIFAQWRGWRIPAVGWQQRLAADLIAAVLMLFASPTVVSSVAAPVAAPAATAVHIPAGTSADPLAPAPARVQGAGPAYTEHHVRAGEQLPALAERYLGDKYRWHAIAAATYGLPQPDGRTLRRGDTRIYPGWTVRIPTTSTMPVSFSLAPPVSAAGQASTSLVYEAREGDWVWYIARRFLGDPDRYPDIAALNLQLAAKYGTAFPDHIEPGDTLRLPADAKDRGPLPHATGSPRAAPNDAGASEAPAPPAGPARPPTGSGSASGAPSAPAPSAPVPSSPTTDQPSASPTTATTPGNSTGDATPTATGTPTTGSHGPAPVPTATPSAQASGQHDGVDLATRGWVTTDVAAAVAAAAALVWIHRRRRYRPRQPQPSLRRDPDLTPLPAAVAALHGSRPTPTAEDDDMDDPEPRPGPAAAVTHATLGTNATGATLRLTDLPTLGVGWTGPGVEDAARGLIVSVLSAPGPWTPATEATLITTRQTLAGLLPDLDTAGIDPLRLHVADTSEQALNELEHQLLYRARLADELAEDTDPADAECEEAGTDEPTLPPAVLLEPAPAGSSATRLAAILAVGSRLGVVAVLLGDWPTGTTWHVNPDGTTGEGRQLNILDQPATAQILDTVAQAHPAELHVADTPMPVPPSPRSFDRALPVDISQRPGHNPRQDPAPAEDAQVSDGASDQPAAQRLQLSVLGRPTVRITNGTDTGDLRIRRSDGIQILVQLAVEPHGVSSDEVLARLWPEIRARHARQRFHTASSELRQTLSAALGADPIQRTDERYHLDPTLVDVDLWHYYEVVDNAATVEPTQHHAALHDVIAAYTGEIAAGQDWLWLAPHREAARRHVLDAYTTLAEAEPDPTAALAIIQDAIHVDPYNEDLYRRAMHLHATLGSSDGVRRALHTLGRRLGELEIRVSPATQQTASHLLQRLDLRDRLRRPAT